MSAGALLYRAALAVALAGGVGGLAAFRWRDEARARALRASAAFAVPLVALAAWVARWIEAGHLPIFGTYESAASMAAAVALAALGWELRARFAAGVAPLCALIAAALLGQGLRFSADVYALTISERSLVVDAHALLAWGAFGLLATNAALALRLVLPGAGEAPHAERWLTRTLELGFLLHSGMMASGSLYKFMLFGKAWSFDPIESLGLVAWVSYGTLLHLHLLAGWRARRLAGWTLLLFALLVISYRLIVYFPSWASYHIFDMDLRLHLQ